MRLLDTSPADRIKIKNMLSLLYSRPYDPELDYRIDAMGAPSILEFKDVLLELASNRKHVQFSAINASRTRVAAIVMEEDAFPPNEFCSPSPKVVMQFLRGHRVPIRKGIPGSICILVDRNPKKASSPSVVNIGSSMAAKRLDAYFKSSSSVELIAVMRITITSVGQGVAVAGVQKGKLNGIRRRGLKRTDLGSEVDDKTYRIVRKLKDKRMDNFGMKDDF